MAAVAIGTSIWLPAILFGHGLTAGLDVPVIVQLNGSAAAYRASGSTRFWLRACLRAGDDRPVECRIHYPLYA